MGSVDHVTLKGNSVITGNNCTGGIVGGNNNSVTNCSAENVTVIVIGDNEFEENHIVQADVAECGGLVIGGGFGAALKIAISQGAKRGLFSNEAGMGSTPHAHAQANVSCPHEQGVVAMIGVFIDTFVVLTLNALVIISTLYTEGGPLADGYTETAAQILDKTNLAQTAFGTVFGESLGAMFVAVCLFFFAFSTILGWNLFGKINVNYLFGKKGVKVYTVIALVFIFLGTVTSNDLVWELTDMFNNLMVIPNAIALFALSGMVVRALPARDGKDRVDQPK